MNPHPAKELACCLIACQMHSSAESTMLVFCVKAVPRHLCSYIAGRTGNIHEAFPGGERAGNH